MRRLCLLAILMVLIAPGKSALGQTLQRGTWTGFVTPPNGVPYASTYSVIDRSGSLHVSMTVSDWGAGFPLHNVAVDNEALRFWWVPIDRVDCELRRDDEGVYRGDCWDDVGNASPMVMAPPGTTVDDEIDEQRVAAEEARRRHEKWSKRRDLDTIDGPRGEMVQIGDSQLNALIAGEGPATVVLLSDVGDDLRTWDYVVDDVKDFARVVAYSRKGIGYSKSGSSKVSIRQAVDNLHGLLDAKKLASPYFLVGHGYGAVLAQAFASAFRKDTGGVVFVDPINADLTDRLERLDADSWNTYWNGHRSLYEMLGGAVQDEFALYERWVTGEELDGVGELPRIPLVVVSLLRVPESPRWVGERVEGVVARRAVHEVLAERHADGTHRSTTRSGHYVQREDPDFLIEVIREMVRSGAGGTVAN